MEWPRKETSVRIYGSDIPRCLDRIMKHFSRDLRAWKIDCSLPARPAILQMITGTSSTSPCKHCRVGGLGRTRRWSVNADTEKKYFLLSWDSQAATVKEILSFPIPCFFFFSFHNWKLHPASYCCTARSSGVFSPHSFTASPPSMKAGALRDVLGMLFHHAVKWGMSKAVLCPLGNNAVSYYRLEVLGSQKTKVCQTASAPHHCQLLEVSDVISVQFLKNYSNWGSHCLLCTSCTACVLSMVVMPSVFYLMYIIKREVAWQSHLLMALLVLFYHCCAFGLFKLQVGDWLWMWDDRCCVIACASPRNKISSTSAGLEQGPEPPVCVCT